MTEPLIPDALWNNATIDQKLDTIKFILNQTADKFTHVANMGKERDQTLAQMALDTDANFHLLTFCLAALTDLLLHKGVITEDDNESLVAEVARFLKQRGN
jgi:hypothetical protein